MRHHGNAIRAQHLLSILYGSLLEMDTLGQDVGLVRILGNPIVLYKFVLKIY